MGDQRCVICAFSDHGICPKALHQAAGGFRFRLSCEERIRPALFDLLISAVDFLWCFGRWPSIGALMSGQRNLA